MAFFINNNYLWPMALSDTKNSLSKFISDVSKGHVFGAVLSSLSLGGPSCQVDCHSELKKFRGVRYRPDRKTFIAEMKPPKSKNKISFGDYKSAEEAARAVDAAFHYYKKNKFLNFQDSPQCLPPVPVEFSDNEKLKFVKKQARRLSSMASVPQPAWDPSYRVHSLESLPKNYVGNTNARRVFSNLHRVAIPNSAAQYSNGVGTAESMTEGTDSDEMDEGKRDKSRWTVQASFGLDSIQREHFIGEVPYWHSWNGRSSVQITKVEWSESDITLPNFTDTNTVRDPDDNQHRCSRGMATSSTSSSDALRDLPASTDQIILDLLDDATILSDTPNGLGLEEADEPLQTQSST